jgi:hypothetical protein
MYLKLIYVISICIPSSMEIIQIALGSVYRFVNCFALNICKDNEIRENVNNDQTMLNEINELDL